MYVCMYVSIYACTSVSHLSLSLSLATSFPLYMSVSLSVCLSLSLFTPSISLSLSLSPPPSISIPPCSLSLSLSLPLHLSLHIFCLLVSFSQRYFILTLFCSSSLLSFPRLCSTCQVGSSSSFDCLLYSTPGSPLFHKAADISSDFAQVNATTSHLPTSEYRIEAATFLHVSVDVRFGRRPHVA